MSYYNLCSDKVLPAEQPFHSVLVLLLLIEKLWASGDLRSLLRRFISSVILLLLVVYSPKYLNIIIFNHDLILYCYLICFRFGSLSYILFSSREPTYRPISKQAK